MRALGEYLLHDYSARWKGRLCSEVAVRHCCKHSALAVTSSAKAQDKQQPSEGHTKPCPQCNIQREVAGLTDHDAALLQGHTKSCPNVTPSAKSRDKQR
jgi:hypothetical protein